MSGTPRANPTQPTVLLRARDLGSHDEPSPRPLPADAGSGSKVIGRARPALLKLSSLMCVDTDDAVMALTYDDGPDPEHTGAVLTALAKRDQRATFFVLAEAATRHPDMVKEMVNVGHEIGLHGWDHTALADVPPARAIAAIKDGAARLSDIVGSPLRFYRPTYGIQGWPQYLTARALGMDVVFWTAWAQDWLDDDEATIASRALAAAHPGGVLLLHDTTADTKTSGLAMPGFDRGRLTSAVLDGLAERGYHALTAGELFDSYPAVRAVTLRAPQHEARAVVRSIARRS